MNARAGVAAVIAAFIAPSLVAPAAEPVLIGVTGDGSSTPESLFSLDLGDGSARFLTTLGNGNDGEVIVFNPADGQLYHLSGRGDAESLEGSILERVSSRRPFTVTDIPFQGFRGGVADFPEEAQSAAYNINSGEFLVSDIGLVGPSGSFLYSVATNGRVRVVANLGFQVKGLAFRGSTLYALEHRDTLDGDRRLDLITLDPDTGAVLSSIDVSLSGVNLNGSSNGLAVNPITGELVAIVHRAPGTGHRSPGAWWSSTRRPELHAVLRRWTRVSPPSPSLGSSASPSCSRQA